VALRPGARARKYGAVRTAPYSLGARCYVLPVVASASAIGPIIARVAYVIGELGAERDASVGRYVRVRAIIVNGALNAGLAYVCSSCHYRLSPLRAIPDMPIPVSSAMAGNT